jgi:hypothetical protein
MRATQGAPYPGEEGWNRKVTVSSASFCECSRGDITKTDDKQEQDLSDINLFFRDKEHLAEIYRNKNTKSIPELFIAIPDSFTTQAL